MTTATTDFETSINDWYENQRKTAQESRATALGLLRQKGVAKIEVEYSGYGDSGDIESIAAICLTGIEIDLDQSLETQVSDAAWALVHQAGHDGFENNEGGDGHITWDIVTDQIHLVHNTNVVTQETSEHDF